LLGEFAETFPSVETVAEPVVRDGRFWSCGGAAAGLDLILDFIRERFGPAAAFDAGAMFLHDGAAASSAEAAKPALASTAPPTLHAALRAMSEALEQPLSVADLARAAGMSERSFHRLFQRELKTTPARYYVLLRLARARDLARHRDLSLREIALRCGFADGETLARSFRRHHGVALRGTGG
jgi:transcriptional regulator GlxA family with amidase domain